MNATYVRRILMVLPVLLIGGAASILFPFESKALNIHSYSDTISESHPEKYSNHTLKFDLMTDVYPGGYIDVQPPAGFEIIATSSFASRNVELYVDGVLRDSGPVLGALVDEVDINPGAPGSIRYNLNPTTGIASGSELELRIGNHTSNALAASVSYSTTTGTTTIYADVEPIKNSSVIGTHKFAVTIGGGAEPAHAQFNIAVVHSVSTGLLDTTEEDPPIRFNGAPSGEVSGTTLAVELSMETNEFAICRMSLTPGVDFFAMNDPFNSTGFIMHTELKQVATNTVNTYYVRCIDDEGNYNIDDYAITFLALPYPTGTPNDEGDNDGPGTGTGNDGTGTGSDGSGGNTGPGGPGNGGTSSGGGGSGGGSGGRSGEDDEDQTGGGFESGDAPYRSGDAEVVIRGYSFPGSTVHILVDGKAFGSVRASGDGSYSVTLSQIARGVYTFGVYAVGSGNVKSSTFSTSFTVTGGRTSNLSNINIMPSIKVSPDPVTAGQSLTISGSSIPDAEITIENQSDKSTASRKSFTTVSNSRGEWSLSVDTTGFSNGTYKVRAKSKQLAGLGLETNFSGYTFYGVGQSADVPLSADLNTDGKVNLTDFSILLFWWGGSGGNSNPPADINRDGSVSLTDFSIMLFNWTG